MDALKKILIVGCLALGGCNPFGDGSHADTSFGACNAFDWKSSAVEQWSEMLLCMHAGRAVGGPRVPIAEKLTISNPRNQQFMGAVMAPNGFLYGIPYGDNDIGSQETSSVLVFNPITETSTMIDFSNPDKLGWEGGVLAPSGFIYGIPNRSVRDTAILKIDTNTNTVSLIEFRANRGTRWAGGTIASNGKIYSFPLDGNDNARLLEFDTSTESVNLITIPGKTGNARWGSTVLGPDGMVYGINYEDAEILKVDPNTGAITTVVNPNNGDYDQYGSVMAPNGKIYSIPNTSQGYYYSFDPVTGTSEELEFKALGGSWSGGAVAPTGMVYGFPKEQVDPAPLLQIDPMGKTAGPVLLIENPDFESWHSGALAHNGKIYALPFSGSSTAQILVIDPRANTKLGLNVVLSPFLNRF